MFVGNVSPFVTGQPDSSNGLGQTHLSNDDASKTNNHLSTDHLPFHNKVPRFIENLDEVTQGK